MEISPTMHLAMHYILLIAFSCAREAHLFLNTGRPVSVPVPGGTRQWALKTLFSGALL